MTKIKSVVKTAISMLEKILVALKIVEKYLDMIPGASSEDLPEEIEEMVKEFEE